jgi:hypothetical protein
LTISLTKSNGRWTRRKITVATIAEFITSNSKMKIYWTYIWLNSVNISPIATIVSRILKFLSCSSITQSSAK